MTSPSAVATVQIDNGTVRVTEWRFAPGATTGFHRHDYPYVVVPMTTGKLAITGPPRAELRQSRGGPRRETGGLAGRGVGRPRPSRAWRPHSPRADPALFPRGLRSRYHLGHARHGRGGGGGRVGDHRPHDLRVHS